MKKMYYIVENHVDQKTIKWSEDIVHLDERRESLYSTYEAAKEHIEKVLVPHSVELRKESNFFNGTAHAIVDGKEQWWVKSLEYFHVVYTIREAGVASE